MRGEDSESGALFSYVSYEARVPADHPLRPIRAIVDEALEVLSPEFERLYSKLGRPSIPPDKLLRALLLQTFFRLRQFLTDAQEFGVQHGFRQLIEFGGGDETHDFSPV